MKTMFTKEQIDMLKQIGFDKDWECCLDPYVVLKWLIDKTHAIFKIDFTEKGIAIWNKDGMIPIKHNETFSGLVYALVVWYRQQGKI